MTILYPSPIFGPVHSRRLGVSLGINLMPADGKLCSFDCLYCECGLNCERRPTLPRPTRSEVAEVLERVLRDRREKGDPLDVLTFAGNGEPTLHPEFAGIIEDTRELRDRYYPEARISVLSNATAAHRPEVHQALLRVDNNIQKLDTVSPSYIRLVDRPAASYDVERIIESLAAFEGHVIVQTMFMSGQTEGISVDNTGDEYVTPWLEALQRIHPEKVMIYTIDRETPTAGLRKAKPEILDTIARRVKESGFQISVSY
ncbi:MAG: radical SAM protein [Bacteroidaceae bacterium]|nr:radical SAM protein [Bacteroidaceae bacterium]